MTAKCAASANRDFHFQIFGLSADRLILDELRRLGGLGGSLLAQKLANPDAAARTLMELDTLIATLEARDRAACIDVLNVHRTSSVPAPVAR